MTTMNSLVCELDARKRILVLGLIRITLSNLMSLYIWQMLSRRAPCAKRVQEPTIPTRETLAPQMERNLLLLIVNLQGNVSNEGGTSKNGGDEVDIAIPSDKVLVGPLTLSEFNLI